MGGGATVWQGTAFQCVSINNEIILRHSQFGGPYNPTGSCNNGEIVIQALVIVNNTYISQLSVIVSPELNEHHWCKTLGAVRFIAPLKK